MTTDYGLQDRVPTAILAERLQELPCDGAGGGRVKERPILFSAPMVRALLAGTKTQTRRVVKPCKDLGIGCELAPCELAGEVNAGDYSNAKYHPGDRLWVRETWYCDDYRVQQGPYLLPDGESADDMRDVGNLVYRADDECPYEQEQPVWRPSIHMPRWASRMMWW